MTANLTGWYFPPTNGGREDGFNDPGIAHFNGSPLSSLARETIQNSLDARKEETEPVEVVFELASVVPDEIGGHELTDAILSSIEQADADGDPSVRDALEAARAALQTKIRCLRVSDRNTTGLLGKNWHALIKMQGLSQKPGIEGAGGSHGIGKYAPFAVSSLRTVFYWTCYEEDTVPVEKFQGKAVLMSHQNEYRKTQGTGFYGIKQNCEEMTEAIPEVFRLLDATGVPVHGTSLLVTGFSEGANWQQRVASSVIENFFYAIASGSLKVIVEPEQSGNDLFEIEESSLGEWFDRLEDSVANDLIDEDGSALKRARDFWSLSDGATEPVEKQDQDLGHCRLWIRVGDNLPSRVALIRRTGMLITDQQAGLQRFPLYRPFAAMCVFEDPTGNELLRRMENPQHNRFEPDRLPEAEKERARKALKRITDWIRNEIYKKAGPVDAGVSTVLSELSVLLPDLNPEEPFDDVSNGSNDGKERGFGDRVTIKLKPIRRSAPTLPSDGEDDGDDVAGDHTGTYGGGGTGENGGEGGTGGAGEGEGQGGTGGQGGGAGRKTLPLSRVRILPVQGSDNRYRVSFRSGKTGTVRLEIEEAGDSSAIPLQDVHAVDGTTLERIDLVSGERTVVEVIADNPIRDRALHVVAVEVEQK